LLISIRPGLAGLLPQQFRRSAASGHPNLQQSGYGLKAFLIAQSLNQIEHAYGQNNAILDNCHVRVCFATNDERTAKRVSESLGTATEQRAMKNYAGHRLSPWLGHLMISKSETARALLTPGEIQELPKTDELVMMAGVHPIRAKKARYFRDRRLSARILPPPEVRAAIAAIGAKHDWQGMIVTSPAPAKRGKGNSNEQEDDAANAGIRTEPELPVHEDIAPPAKPVSKEFDFDRDGQADDDAANNRRLQERMRGNARRASLDPDDGISL
jgi:type IV secretion system protein VirD4